MDERHIKFYSHILGRDIDLLVSGHWGYPILMFPTSMGNYLQNRDFGLNHSIAQFVNDGRVKLYNVDSIDFQSFYGRDLPPDVKIHNYNLYTRFIKEELVPAIQRECSVHRIAVAGCSFGGFHCTNFALKYPDLVEYCFSMSGAFDIKSFMKGYFDDNVYFNNPVDYMQSQEGWKYNHMKIVLGTSDWDICKADNVNMSHILRSRGIHHWYDEKQWASHDWPLWRMMFPEYVGKMLAGEL
ncbi:alpha/beta fold hydrolase [Emticicia fluvialis]|uniref:alpha/beta fold hydrolase n=1 Tax=Emticicia fluvialis TaxID=2974474 RepID=UPI0021652899|nr:alpha/beta fold hydrolase [Emticicia fluvialis]